MGAAAVAQPFQLRVFARKDFVLRSKAARESCCLSISGFPSIPFSLKSDTRYVSSVKGSLSSSGRRNLAPNLDGRRRGRCSRSCFESGVAETAENSADSTASRLEKRPTAPGDEQDAGKEGDLLEVEENELDVFRAAALLDGIEEKLQQLERQNGKYQGSTHEEEFQEQQQAPASLLGDEGAKPKGLLEQMREIFVFAGPALGIWLSGPLMSIIDTAVVGNSSTLELAALGPGTVLCDQTTYVFMFLSIATSNLIATALAQKSTHCTEPDVRTGIECWPEQSRNHTLNI